MANIVNGSFIHMFFRFSVRPVSLVVEHQSCKLEVTGSTPVQGLCQNLSCNFFRFVLVDLFYY